MATVITVQFTFF